MPSNDGRLIPLDEARKSAATGATYTFFSSDNDLVVSESGQITPSLGRIRRQSDGWEIIDPAGFRGRFESRESAADALWRHKYEA